MRAVHVVSFAPSSQGAHDGHVSGFEWFEDRRDALLYLVNECTDGVAGYDYMLRTVLVPDFAPSSDAPEVTAWLDERPDLWDVPAVSTDHITTEEV